MRRDGGKSGEANLRVALICAFVLLIFCFLGSSGYALSVSNGIREASESIAFNSSPSVLRLASARTELRRLETTVHRLLGREYFNPFDGQAIEKSMATLEREISDYERLPVDRGEALPAQEIRARQTELRTSIEKVVELAASDRPGARSVAEARISPLVERLDVALQDAADLNGQRANESAREILKLHNDGKRTELSLDILSTGFGALLLFLVIHALNRYTRLLEQQRRETEARANELDDFSGRVAHDIRGPLASLSMALELAGQMSKETSTQDMLGRARRSLTRATDIVDGLYEFARSGAKPLPYARCEARAVLVDLVEDLQPLAQAAQVELRLEAANSVWAACSPGVFSSIVGNLTRNALKYMGPSEVRRITVRLVTHEEGLRLEVEDTGPGLPPDFLAVIFEPHARALGTNQPGLGLGLATVKRLARAHGGGCSVTSTPGQGCCFRVDLPVTEDSQTRSPG